MKILAILLFFLGSYTFSSDTLLPKNEAGVIHFAETVEVENLDREILFKNALNYASRVKKVSKRSSIPEANMSGGKIEKEGGFYVYTQGLFTPQIHGEITFTLQIEVGDGYYKYAFTDFVFQYYQRNRYGRYAPVNGKKKPLEEEKFAGRQGTWYEHKKYTKEVIDNHVRVLKNEMAQVPAGVRTND